MSEALVLTELNKVYRRRDKQEVHAVRDVDLEVRQGELLALLGPSGCGKSSTLRMIAGLEEVTSGDILIGGSSVVSLPPHRRNIALAFENYALYPPLTVQENITFGLRARSARDPEKRASEIAERLDITDILGQKPGALSTGQKQRVSLARALVRDPSVLLLDEPLSHLDLAQRDQTRREIKRLQEETGYTTVLVTHDQLEALSMADRIALMNEGKLQQVGTPEEVYDDPDNLFVAGFVGDPPMNHLRGRARKTERGMSMWLSDETDLPVASSSLSPDQQVVVGIRPQDVHVVESDGPDVLHATVFAFEPLQETGLLTATLPGVETRIEAETDPHARFNREEAVRLRLDPDRMCLFDAESGDRIR